MSLLSKYICVGLILLSFISCKSLKVNTNSEITKKTSVKEMLAIHKAKNFNYKTLKSKVKINYNDGKKTVPATVTLRMEKDSKIWLSAKFLGFVVAKAYITPTRVSFYEKLKKRYYDSDFKALSHFLGQEVDFQKIQNIFLGQSVIDLHPKNLNAKWEPQTHTVRLVPKKQNSQFNLELLLNTLTNKIASYKAQKNDKLLAINYVNYQKIFSQDFPEIMQIEFNQKEQNRAIKMNFRSVTINEDISFPYTIPEGYTKFVFKK